ncbi:MAG: hypothetical protein ACK5MF_03165 [Vibrio sp.]|uniref:hypothetical protein n=1 Tax=Vibrio sp. TaxID=678 RepID=UPI003A853E96
MYKYILFLSLVLSSFMSYSCGLHQNTGFNLITEPGSLEVFQNVIDARRDNLLLNKGKPDQFLLYTIKAKFDESQEDKLDFVLFEAVKGHYSDFKYTDNHMTVTGKNKMPEKDELMLITELDVLDALASGVIDWEQATQHSLIKLVGPQNKKAMMNEWFSKLF